MTIPQEQIRSAVDVIEASYQSPEADWKSWINSVAEALRPVLNAGEGVVGWCYDARDLNALKLDHVTALGVHEGFLPALMRASVDPRASLDLRRSHYLTIAGPFSVSCGEFFAEFDPAWHAHLSPLGIEDMLVINAMNFGFKGCAFSTPTRERLAPNPLREALLARVSAHVVSAYRLRSLSNLGAVAGEAVIEPNGKVAHAEGEATHQESRAALSRAAQAMELARGKMRRADPEESLSIWASMVEGRWTLVDQFESDGKRYLVAKVNEPASRTIGTLSRRESQVAALASVGRSNKAIAYELGLAEGTITTLLARAREKLGASSVGELITKISPTWDGHKG